MIKRIITLIGLLAVLAAVSACAAQKPAGGDSALSAAPVQPVKKDLLHHNYVLQSLDGKDFVSEFKTPNLSFNEGFRVSGQVCNSFFGQAELADGVLWVENMASTMMLCPDPKLNELEGLFGQMLRAGARVELDGDKLILRQGGHELVYKLRDYVN